MSWGSWLKSVSLIIIAIIFAFSIPADVWAKDEQFYSDNIPPFYDPDAVDCSATSSTTLSGKDNREKIYNFLIQNGLNGKQASGVLGNLQAESGFSPLRHEDSAGSFERGGYGIAQWTGGRRTALIAYIDSKAPELKDTYYRDGFGGAVTEEDGFVPRDRSTNEIIPVADNDKFLMLELEFLMDETKGRRITSSTASVSSATAGDNEWEAIKKASSVKEAAYIWVYNFEIPANIAQTAAARADFGTTIYSLLNGSSSDESSSSSSICSSTSSGDVTAVQATIKAYAWPDYRGSHYTKKKTEYDAAITKASASGGYIGGAGGVDCGAFVTRVIVDSGFDPNYNSGKGPTGEQRRWLNQNWQKLGSGNTIDTSTLQPGDVAIRPGHTFMFAGTDIDGFGNVTTSESSPLAKYWKGVASASLGDRAPMAGLEDMTASNTVWYRKKSVSHE